MYERARARWEKKAIILGRSIHWRFNKLTFSNETHRLTIKKETRTIKRILYCKMHFKIALSRTSYKIQCATCKRKHVDKYRAIAIWLWLCWEMNNSFTLKYIEIDKFYYIFSLGYCLLCWLSYVRHNEKWDFELCAFVYRIYAYDNNNNYTFCVSLWHFTWDNEIAKETRNVCSGIGIECEKYKRPND